MGKRTDQKAAETRRQGNGTADTPLLQVTDLSVTLGQTPVLKDVSFSVQEGEWLMMIGPNGAGKSTLVNAVSRGVPFQGEVKILGEDVEKYPSRALARLVGCLSQNHYVGYGFTVEEVVRLGLYSRSGGFFSGRQTGGEALVEKSLRDTGLLPFRSHSVLTLSGGELQRTFLAQLFVQDPRILILDEPANHLDLVYQKEIFSLVGEWLKQPGRAVISVVHDLSLAKRYGTRALLLKDGQALALGTVMDVMTPALLNSVYGMDVYGWMRSLYGQWQET